MILQASRREFGKPAGTLLVLAASLLASPISLPAQGPSKPAPEHQHGTSVSSYLPTPLPVVEKMLEVAAVQPNERVYDLGSGDGRILILAAQKHGARGVGIELDPQLSKLSLERIRDLGLQRQVRIIEGDFMDEDLGPADIVTIFLDPKAMPTVKAHLEKYLHHGMRIVVCDAEMPGWKATSTTAAFDADTQKTYKIHLYTISRPSDWVSFSRFGKAPSSRHSH